MESAIDVMDGKSSSFGLIDVGFDIDTIAAGIKSTGAVIPPRLYMYETAGRRLFEIMAHHTLMIFIIRALAASGLGSTASVHALFVQPDLLLKLRYPAMFRSRLMVQDKLGRGEENTSAGRMDCERCLKRRKRNELRAALNSVAPVAPHWRQLATFAVELPYKHSIASSRGSLPTVHIV